MSISQIILAFVVAVLVIYLIFWLYKYYTRRSVVQRQSEILVDGQHDATKHIVIDRRKIPLSVQGNEYTVSFWIFIKDFNYRYGNTKTILYRGDKENTQSNPSIYLHPNNNDMTIKLQLQTDTIDQNLKDIEQQSKALAATKKNEVVTDLVSLPSTSPSETLGPDISTVGTSAPILEDPPILEPFVVPLPMRYFRKESKELFSNISGNQARGTNQMERFEETDPTTGPTVAAENSSSQPENVGDVDNRLDKVELQVQKLMGINDKNSEKNKDGETQGQIDDPQYEMPIVYDECVINNVPIQKWTYFSITVFNNHVEVYKDGKLHKACSLKGFPKPSVEHLHVTAIGGFNGYLSNLEYSNMAVTQTEVYQSYRKGPKLVRGLGDKLSDFWSGFTSIFKE